MSDLSRTYTLDGLRDALRRGGPVPVPEAPAPAPASLPADPWGVLTAALGRVNVPLTVAATPEAAREAIQAVLAEFSARTVAMWRHPDLGGLGLPALLERLGVGVVEPGASDGGDECFCRKAATCDLGITSAHAVLLDTGTILVRAGLGLERSTSIVPPVHLAVIPRRALAAGTPNIPGIVRSLCEDGTPPSALHLITGPSSTRDIELAQVFGVHGPMAVRAVGLDFDL
ncbi:MAG: LUD domain-containing protein [Desulfovibrionaceae bacterium]